MKTPQAFLLSLTEVVALADVLVLLLAACISIARFKQLPPTLKWLAIYLCGICMVELLAKLFLYVLTDYSNLFLMHFYTLFEFISLSLMYKKWLRCTGAQTGLFNYYLVVTAALIFAYSLIIPQLSVTGFELYSKPLVNGCIMLYAVLFFARVIANPAQLPANEKGLITLNSAMLVYFSASLVIFLTITYFVNKAISESVVLWFINVIMAIALHVLCTWYIFKRSR